MRDDLKLNLSERDMIIEFQITCNIWNCLADKLNKEGKRFLKKNRCKYIILAFDEFKQIHKYFL